MLRRLLLLNGIAVIFAVISHSVDWVLTGMFYWADRYQQVTIPYYDSVGGLFYNYLVLLDHVSVSAVPAFLIVSGIFIAITTGSQKRTPEWSLVFNRIKILIWPYLLWSLVGLAYHTLDGQHFTPLGLLRMFLAGGVFAPYYYVPLLIQLYILSPLIFPLAKERPGVALAIALITKGLATLGYYVAVLDIGPAGLDRQLSFFRDWHLLSYGVWYILGIVIGLRLTRFKELLYRYRYWLLGVVFVSLAASFIESSIVRQVTDRPWTASQIMLSNSFLSLTMVLSYFGFELALPRQVATIIENLGKKSFGIYLIHVPVIILTARIYQKLVPALLAFPMLFQAAMIIAGLAVPLLMMEIVNRSFARRFYRYFFG